MALALELNRDTALTQLAGQFNKLSGIGLGALLALNQTT